MGDLVRDHLGHPLQFGKRSVIVVHEERRLAERDATEVLHRPHREVRQGDQVELRARVGDPEPLGEEPDRVSSGLECELGEVFLARYVDDGDRHPVHFDRMRLMRADRPRRQPGKST